MSSFPPRMPWAEMYVRSGLKSLSDRMRQQALVRRMRGAVADVRSTVREVARSRIPEATSFVERVVKRVLAEPEAGPAMVINATGVIAPRGLSLPLADAAIAAMADTAEGTATGESAAVAKLLCDATGAQGALVLHSASLATLAVLGTLGGDVVLSCDHAAEIEGSPLGQLAAAAGASLVIVGSTGRVSREDYRRALEDDDTLCVWHAVQASLAIQGDICAPPRDEIFAIARDASAISLEFLESGTFSLAAGAEGFFAGPGQALNAGADLVIFAGDRLLGGPPCGVVLGRSDLVSLVAEHPLAQAGRLDAVRTAALEATLTLASSAEHRTALPLVQLLAASSENLKHRAERLATLLASCDGVASAQAVPCPGWLAAGELPAQQLDGWGVSLFPTEGSADHLMQRLMSATPSVATTVHDGQVLINLRSVLGRHDAQIPAALGQRPAPTTA